MPRILAIDDENGVRKLLHDILDGKGYECVTAADAAEARNLLKSEQIDLILCDIHMPGESGLEFLGDILPEYPDTAAVIITGDNDNSIVDAALEIGVYDYITKPIERDRLLVSVANALHRRELTIQSRHHQSRLEKEIASRTQALRDSEQRLLSLFKNSKDIIFIFSEDSKLLEINKAGLELFGYNETEIASLSALDFFPDPPDFKTLHKKIRKDGFVKDFYQDVKSKNGTIVPTLITVSTRQDEAGNILEYQGILRDITCEKKSREKLKASEAKYRELVQSANWIVLKWDKAGRVTFINDFAQRFFGFSEAEIINQFLIGTIVPPLDYDGRNLEAMIQEIIRQPENSINNENENMRRNGDRVWVSWTNRPILSDQGEVIGILSIGQDITERKKAVQALSRNFEFLQQLIDTLPNPVFYKDSSGVYRLCNIAFEQSIGLSRNDIVGKTIYDLAPKDLADSFSEVDRQLIRQSGTKNYESRIRYEDGSLHDVIFYKAAITDHGGIATGIVGVMLDITERKRAEKERVHLATAIDQADETIVVTDAEGVIQYVNPAFEKYTGYSREETIGQTPRILKSGKQDAAFYKSMWSEILSGRVWSGHITNRRKDGTLLEEEARISPIRNQAGEIVNFVAVKRDVSKQMAMERQLRQAQRIEAIGTLAGGIAHEINTPIQYVLYNTRFLQEKFMELNPLFDRVKALIEAGENREKMAPLLDEAGKLIERIDLSFIQEEIPPAIEQTIEGAERVADIVRAMKEFSHPGSDEKSMVDLNKAIESTITVARNEWKYVAEMQTDLDPDLPLVPCLPGDFNQVILNLIVNAAHAIADVVGDGSGEKGLISIRTGRNNGWAEIRVADTGTGIAEENRPRIFDPFFTTKEVGRGTGQGLAISHSVIVEKHGGVFGFETETGKGTTFLIQLPLEEKSI